MAENLNEEKRKKDLELLEASYDMYETSKAETIDMRRNKKDKDGNRIYSEESLTDTMDLINVMQADIVAQYTQLGGNPEDLKKRKVKKRNDKRIKEAVERLSAKKALEDFKEKAREDAKRRERNKYSGEAAESAQEAPVAPKQPIQEAPVQPKVETHKNDYRERNIKMLTEPAEEPENVNKPRIENAQPQKQYQYNIPNAEAMNLAPQTAPSTDGGKPMTNYDEVTLPSKGECYSNKMGKIRVSHLVAYDENLILAPGLYKNGTFLDHILKNKILDNIDPDSLVQGDRDAIIIWLRAGGYGPLYPIKVTDESTGEEFQTDVNLAELKFKKFTLKGDENGYFDYKLPVSGDIVKFKFLTAGDAKKLEKMRSEENEAENAGAIRSKIRDIRDFVEKSDKFTSKEQEDIVADLIDLNEIIYDRYKSVDEIYYTHDLTNRLVMSTISVNGISDRQYVANYIMNMSLKDAAEYRKYIIDNEPGVDYNIKVKRPDSLGGGYVETFLQLDQFIFIY